MELAIDENFDFEKLIDKGQLLVSTIGKRVSSGATTAERETYLKMIIEHYAAISSQFFRKEKYESGFKAVGACFQQLGSLGERAITTNLYGSKMVDCALNGAKAYNILNQHEKSQKLLTTIYGAAVDFTAADPDNHGYKVRLLTVFDLMFKNDPKMPQQTKSRIATIGLREVKLLERKSTLPPPLLELKNKFQEIVSQD